MKRFIQRRWSLISHHQQAPAEPTYMPPGHLHGSVPVHVGQQAQAETLRVGGIRESVDCQRGLRSVEGLPHTLVQLVVGYRAPEGRLRVGHRLQVCGTAASAGLIPEIKPPPPHTHTLLSGLVLTHVVIDR